METSSLVYDLYLRYTRPLHNNTIYQQAPDNINLHSLLRLCLNLTAGNVPQLDFHTALGQYLVYNLVLIHEAAHAQTRPTCILLCELRSPTHISGLLLIQRMTKLPRPIEGGSLKTSIPSSNHGQSTKIGNHRHFLDFYHWLGLVFLLQPEWYSTSLSTQFTMPNTFPSLHAPDLSCTQGMASVLCRLFEELLLFRAASNDHWTQPQGGRLMFLEKLCWFIDRNIPVRFALPAFPCKSSNTDKTIDTLPNGGEFEALDNLHIFCKTINSTYRPGCIVDVVSDGHVFSDCIGVHDDVVALYSARLQAMSMSLHKSRCVATCRKQNPIKFHDLESLVFPNDAVRNSWDWVSPDFIVHHPVQTRRTLKDDVCRRILLQSCQTSHKWLRQSIQADPNSSLTKLYRGFSKFMLEDLAAQQEMQTMSKSKRKKHAEAVAFEMMRRNQAYSHLVEMLMPHHIRLSIHAHNNLGPKFAISLLPSSRFRVLESFDMGHLNTIKNACEVQHLHIPTPWHNVLVEIQGCAFIFVCKAALVMAELSKFDSQWDPSSGYCPQHPRGGRYILKPKPSTDISVL